MSFGVNAPLQINKANTCSRWQVLIEFIEYAQNIYFKKKTLQNQCIEIHRKNLESLSLESVVYILNCVWGSQQQRPREEWRAKESERGRRERLDRENSYSFNLSPQTTGMFFHTPRHAHSHTHTHTLTCEYFCIPGSNRLYLHDARLCGLKDTETKRGAVH